jgi:hypothetical protein
VAARGGTVNPGGSGRARIDVQTSDTPGFAADCSRAAPACRFGVSGPLVAQSIDAYALPVSSPLAIFEAQLLAAPGAAADSLFSAAASSNDPPDFAALPAAEPRKVTFVSSGPPVQGSRFRWKAQLFPQPDQPRALLGLQWQLRVK